MAVGPCKDRPDYPIKGTDTVVTPASICCNFQLAVIV